VTFLKSAVGHLCSLGIILGGAVPYVPQFLQIRRSHSQGGFSLYVCLVLLAANTLRIVFWFGRPFELPLLLQSIVMMVVMLAMVRCCVAVRGKGEGGMFMDLEPEHFWHWADMQSYVECVLTFATVAAAAMWLLLDRRWFVEAVGFAALLTEAMLAAPQLWANWRARSTSGMSRGMVLGWLAGDVFKTAYASLRASPVQFVVCGSVQIGLDLCVLLQCVVYRNKRL